MYPQIIFYFFIVDFIKGCVGIQKYNFKVWGPGLQPDVITMPARYFFIETLENQSEQLLKSDFKVKVEGHTETKKSCRIWFNILDRLDNTFIIRYKLYENCKSFKITVKYKDLHIGESPYIIKNVVYSDECDCPKEKLNVMLQQWNCGTVPQQILNDISQFDNINWNELRDKIIMHFDNPNAISLCHYVIKNNDLFRKCYGKYVGFKMFMDNMLLSLKRKYILPDLEFFVNLGDWPLVKKNSDKYPVFSWCGSTDTYDILMPTYDISESTLENMGRVMLDMLSVQGNVNFPWSKRIPKIFWRGRDSSEERLHLIDIARNNPELFNASLTNFFFFRDKEDRYGPKTDHVSFFSFFDYKYQLNLDGTVAAYRLPYLLGGGSLLLKQDSKYYEHFYNQLTPNVHYIPIERDLSDLLNKINWAKHNDDDASKIANAGQQFAVENLLPKNIFCYYAMLLQEFHIKVINEVKVFEDMEKVEQSDKSLTCNCFNVKDEL